MKWVIVFYNNLSIFSKFIQAKSFNNTMHADQSSSGKWLQTVYQDTPHVIDLENQIIQGLLVAIINIMMQIILG